MKDKCLTCGSPVKIVGKTTKCYQPVELDEEKVLEVIKDCRTTAPEYRTDRNFAKAICKAYKKGRLYV